MLSEEIISKLEKTMQKLTRICSSVCTFDTSLLFSVCCISLAQLLIMASVLLSIYAKPSSHLLPVERESGSKHEGTVFTLARLKIVPSYPQELV